MLLAIAGPAGAASVTVSDQNSSLKFTVDDIAHLARTVEWTVDGRRILVYPSSPLMFVDVGGHMHTGSHVGANQVHAQGTLLGSQTSPNIVTGGVVYTVSGGAAGSGVSRISEKVDLHNTSAGTVSVLLTGLGFKSPQAALEVPDLSGLTVTGTTVVFHQGNAVAASITEPPFAPVTVLPVVSFSGFNPLLNQPLVVPSGARLTLVSELKVAPAPLFTVITVVWLLLVLLAAGAAALVWRRRQQPSR
jgi:hypothetical protein